MLRLFDTRLDPHQAANLVLFLAVSDDPDAREVGELIRLSLLDPFPEVALTDVQRAAVRRAIQSAPPDRLKWAKQHLLRAVGNE